MSGATLTKYDRGRGSERLREAALTGSQPACSHAAVQGGMPVTVSRPRDHPWPISTGWANSLPDLQLWKIGLLCFQHYDLSLCSQQNGGLVGTGLNSSPHACLLWYCSGLNCVLQKDNASVLTPGAVNGALVRNKIFADIIKSRISRWDYLELRVGPKSESSDWSPY